MRQSLIEKAKNREINYADEMFRVEKLFSEAAIIQYYKSHDYMHLYPQHTTLSSFFDSNMFFEYPYAERFISLTDMRVHLGISVDAIRRNDINIMLDYFEFIFNILNFFINNYKNYNVEFNIDYIRKISVNITSLLDKLNYELKESNDYVHIVEKNATTTAVSEIYEDIADEVIEYRRYNLKGDIKRKCEILNALANKFEAIRPDLKANNFTEIEDKTGCMLNNLDIRHNNVNGKNKKDIVKQMSDEELEQWYDRTYDLLLMCFMFHHYLDFRDKIKDLNKNLKNKL